MAYQWHGQPWPTEQHPRRATDPSQAEATHCAKGTNSMSTRFAFNPTGQE